MLWGCSHNLSCHNSYFFLCTEGSICLVDLLIDCLALQPELTVVNASYIEECNQYDFDFWLLLSLTSAMSDTFTDCSGTWFLGCTQKSVSLPMIILQSKSSLVWRHSAHPVPLFFSTCSGTTWKRGGVNKSMWKKIQWLQKRLQLSSAIAHTAYPVLLLYRQTSHVCNL